MHSNNPVLLSMFVEHIRSLSLKSPRMNLSNRRNPLLQKKALTKAHTSSSLEMFHREGHVTLVTDALRIKDPRVCLCGKKRRSYRMVAVAPYILKRRQCNKASPSTSNNNRLRLNWLFVHDIGCETWHSAWPC